VGTSSFVDMSMMWGNMPNKYWSRPGSGSHEPQQGGMMETISRPGGLLWVLRGLWPEVTLKDTRTAGAVDGRVPRRWPSRFDAAGRDAGSGLRRAPVQPR
jgi:hypothetical protein